jgi:hypothetical protein
MEWERKSYHRAYQVTRFDPFTFLCMGEHKEHFFSWGYIKNLLYQTKVQDVDELRCQITAACETVKPVVLQNS